MTSKYIYNQADTITELLNQGRTAEAIRMLEKLKADSIREAGQRCHY